MYVHMGMVNRLCKTYVSIQVSFVDADPAGGISHVLERNHTARANMHIELGCVCVCTCMGG